MAGDKEAVEAPPYSGRASRFEHRLAERRLAVHEALVDLETMRLPLDETQLENVNTPDDLRRLR